MWIVSYFDDIYTDITVTAFDNYEAAYKMYEHEYESGMHYCVSLNNVKVYSNYEVF